MNDDDVYYDGFQQGAKKGREEAYREYSHIYQALISAMENMGIAIDVGGCKILFCTQTSKCGFKTNWWHVNGKDFLESELALDEALSVIGKPSVQPHSAPDTTQTEGGRTEFTPEEFARLQRENAALLVVLEHARRSYDVNDYPAEEGDLYKAIAAYDAFKAADQAESEPTPTTEEAKRAVAWIKSPEGQAAIAESLTRAGEMIREFAQAQKIDPALLTIPMMFRREP